MGVSPVVPEMKFRTGDVVIVRRGKHTGTQFVVVGAEGFTTDRVMDDQRVQAGDRMQQSVGFDVEN